MPGWIIFSRLWLVTFQHPFINLSYFLIEKFKENSIQPQDICILDQSNVLLRGFDFEIRNNTGQKTYTTFETEEIIYTALTRCRKRLFILNINNTGYDNFFREEIPTQNIVELKKPKNKTLQNSSKQQTLAKLVEEDA